MDSRNRIFDIITYKGSNRFDSVQFIGLLRNEIKFDLHENVFIEAKGKMMQCKIVGIELPLDVNGQYKYKVELPEAIFDYFSEKETTRITLICDYIFRNIEDAKKSAYEKINLDYKLNKERVDAFFKRYE
jgi:hypothetical protein